MSFYQNLKNKGTALVFVGLTSATMALPSHAALADLAGAIDTTDILAGFTAVALLIAAVLAGRMGIKKVLGMIR